jgi:hypothetical protein
MQNRKPTRQHDPHRWFHLGEEYQRPLRPLPVLCKCERSTSCSRTHLASTQSLRLYAMSERHVREHRPWCVIKRRASEYSTYLGRIITCTGMLTCLRVCWIMPALGVVPPSRRFEHSSTLVAPACSAVVAERTESTQTSSWIDCTRLTGNRREASDHGDECT